MVTVLYLLILAPVVAYLIFSVIEIWITYLIAIHKHTRSLLFVQASTEVTHTLLVFAYAQFMVTFSALLVDIGARLWWPIALLMVTLLVRASLYLLLFYRERTPRWMYGTLLVSYLLGVAALVWALFIIIPAIISKGFVPYTADMDIVLLFGVPALAIFMIPLVTVYRHAFKQLKK